MTSSIFTCRSLLTAMTLCSFFALPFIGQAEEEHAFSFKGFSEITHNDNLYSKHSSPDSTAISTIGAKFGYRNKGLVRFSVNGQVAENHYARESDLNHTSYSIAPRLSYDSGRYLFTLEGFSSYSISPADNSDRAELGFLRQTKSYNHRVSTQLDYRINERFGIISEFSWSQKDYIDYDRPLDYDRYTIALAPYYRINEYFRTGIRTGVQYNHYKEDNGIGNSKQYFFNGWGEYLIDQKITARLEAGLASTDYNDAESFTGFNMAAILNYRYSDKLSFNARISSILEDSVASYVDVKDTRSRLANTVSIGSRWNILSNLSWNNRLSYIVYDEKNSISDSASFSYSSNLHYQIVKEFAIYGGYTYDHSNYRHIDNNYQRNTVKIGAELTF